MSLTSTPRAAFIVGAFLASALSMLAGCEDKAIGRQCDAQADAGVLQAAYNGQALECPTRICLKPAREVGVSMGIDTAPYCTAECSKDSDCEGEDRGKGDADKRCKSGFVCGVAFEVGPLCCKKLCLCKDFIGTSGIRTPASCMESRNPTSTCQNL